MASGFSFHPTGRLFVALGDSAREPAYDAGQLEDVCTFALEPAAAVLSYGVSCFEGLKAFRQPDGSVAVFRPDRNAARLASSAEALGLPPVPVGTFLRGCIEVVRSCIDLVPAPGTGSMYLRPLLFGTEPLLGVSAGATARFHVFASPVGNYFAGHGTGGVKGLKLQVPEGARVPPGGLGNVKVGGNYASTLRARRAAHQAGDDDVLYVDARTRSFIEETASSNVFAVMKDGRIVTPSLDGSILPGVTRESLIVLAREDLGMTVEERPLPFDEVVANAEEFFAVGTAVVIAPVGVIRRDGRAFNLPTVNGRVASALRDRLVGIQEGRIQDTRGWLRGV